MIEFSSSGTPYDRGLAHGKTFAALVREHIAVTCQIEAGHEAEIADLLSCIENNIRLQAPANLEEARGIADGAGVDLASILKLNYWPEVTSATVGLRFCSLVAFTDVDDGPIIGKTSDHPLVSIRFLALQRVGNRDGYDYIRGTFLGTLGTRAGINQAGLTISGATIVPKTFNPDGVPVMVLMQRILEKCGTVDEAIALAETMPAVNYGAHLMVGDANGDVAVIERMPMRMAVRRPVDGLLYNTNHPLGPETREHNGADAALNENSHARFTRLGSLISQTPHTVEGIQSILRDHTQPGAICQHGGPAGLHTTGAYVLLPAGKTMRVAPGCPCQHDFVPYCP